MSVHPENIGNRLSVVEGPDRRSIVGCGKVGVYDIISPGHSGLITIDWILVGGFRCKHGFGRFSDPGGFGCPQGGVPQENTVVPVMDGAESPFA
ncbi:hypothetical protein SDC9_188127 [bioreactor metagenome]|uniref:Uncharacterized protein n=1 Tax=bioreactor metagenome TaxID=1076179 RepID=A0A645HQS3_9ZZZZ